jgi:hypothetical protein
MKVNQGGIAKQHDRRRFSWFFNSTRDITDMTFSGTNGTAPSACRDAAGGGVLLTQGAADNDDCIMETDNEFIRFNTLNETYRFKWVVQFSDATQIDWFLLLAIDTADYHAGYTDGLGFHKDDGDTEIDVKTLKNSAGTTETAVETADANRHTYEIVVRTTPTAGVANIEYLIDNKQVAYLYGKTICDDEELKMVVMVQNGEAVAKTAIVWEMSYDIPNPVA